jgi:hypothetical protein
MACRIMKGEKSRFESKTTNVADRHHDYWDSPCGRDDPFRDRGVVIVSDGIDDLFERE